MKVEDIMTREVQCCGPDTNLAKAAKMMWDNDCGALPVLNVEGRVLGMITDRDICMSVSTKSKPASAITVWETITPKAYTCHPSEDIHTALDIMKRERVHRLPVIDDDGILQGIIALNDIILGAGEAKGRKTSDVSCEDVLRALKAISAHRVLVGI
jgi:CBS domain-containing protein